MHNLATWTKPFGSNDQGFKNTMIDLIKSDDIYHEYKKDIRAEFESKMAKYLPTGLNAFCYGVSGTEAIEHALVLAHLSTGKNVFMRYTGCYHGNSIALTQGCFNSMSSQIPNKKVVFDDIPPPYCLRCKNNYCNEYRCLHEIFEKIEIENDYAGILIDPSFGNILLDPGCGYFQLLEKYCKERHIHIIFDEVRTGLGRSGPTFAFQKYNIQPDILCLSKAVASGYPLSMTIYNRDFGGKGSTAHFQNNWETTFAGQTLGLKIAAYTIERLERERLGILSNQIYFLEKLHELKQYQQVGDIRANGMIFAIEFVSRKGEYRTSTALQFKLQAFENGVLLDDPGYKSIQLLHPYLNISKAEIDDCIDVFHRILS